MMNKSDGQVEQSRIKTIQQSEVFRWWWSQCKLMGMAHLTVE